MPTEQPCLKVRGSKKMGKTLEQLIYITMRVVRLNRDAHEEAIAPLHNWHLDLILLPETPLEGFSRCYIANRQRHAAHLSPPLRRIRADVGKACEPMDAIPRLCREPMTCSSHRGPIMLLLKRDSGGDSDQKGGVRRLRPITQKPKKM